MTTHLVIPPEGDYTAQERNWIDYEPPNVHPESQDSFWGQMRAVYAGYIQTEIVDVLNNWWNQLDPANAVDPFLARFERLVGLPPESATKPILLRRAFVQARLERGRFTRARRDHLIELFIIATFGQALEFTPDGIAFTSGGMQFFSGVNDLTGTYTVEEDVAGYSFAITIDDDIDIDIDGLTREMSRISPYAFTVTSAPL